MVLQALGRRDAGLGLEKCPGLAAGSVRFPPARPGKFLPRGLMNCGALESRIPDGRRNVGCEIQGTNSNFILTQLASALPL